MHPEIFIPMERGLVGGHTGQTKERLMAYSASPVPPHAPIPDDYVAPAGFEKWVWAELDQELAVMCGLQSVIGDPEAAKRLAADPECKVLQVRLGDVAMEEAIVDGDAICRTAWGATFFCLTAFHPGSALRFRLKEHRQRLLFGFDVFVGQIDPASVAASPRLHGRLPSQKKSYRTQQQEEEEAAAADAFRAAGNRRAVPAAWEPGQLNVIQRLWEELELEDLPAVPPHVDQENIIMMDTAVGVKTVYGAHGASVQVWPADQTPWLSDREVMQKLLLVMQKLLLVGKPEIPLREFASKLRRYNKAMLEQVVEAGLRLYPVGERQLRNLLIQNAVPRPEAPVE
eukprot:s7036_g1.t1